MNDWLKDFDRSNKATGVYWCQQPLNRTKFCLTIKPESGFAFKSYLLTNAIETEKKEHIFEWQEKVFSKWEYEKYKDIHNCVTETEVTYNDKITNSNVKVDKVFTYINEDDFVPPDLSLNTRPRYLNSFWSRLNLDSIMLEDSHADSTKSLYRSQENIDEECNWSSMYIVSDNSTYNEDSQLLLKQESVLLQIHYNSQKNYFLISPDTNDIYFNPYSVELESGVLLEYIYSVQMIHEPRTHDVETMCLLYKLLEKLKIERRHIDWDTTVPLDKRKSFITLEIISLEEFEADNLYVEYNIKVPEELMMNIEQHGATHISKATKINNVKMWHYMHQLDIELCYSADVDTEQACITIYFEVISKNWMGIQRTEGYSFINLKLNPGHRTQVLTCQRPEELDVIQAENRRFFLGGCHLIQDLDVLAEPQSQDTKFRLVTTGKINVQSQTVVQNCNLSHNTSHIDGIPKSRALQGAEIALRRYKKAKARLAAASKDLIDNAED